MKIVREGDRQKVALSQINPGELFQFNGAVFLRVPNVRYYEEAAGDEVVTALGVNVENGRFLYTNGVEIVPEVELLEDAVLQLPRA